MPSITSWLRLEPRSRQDSIDLALQARVQDPLWFLARQWQMNEFKGADAGSPVSARLEGDAFRLTRCFLGDLPPDGHADGQAFDPAAIPLETLVEREPHARAATVNVRLSADAGRCFARLLDAYDLQKYAAAYLKSFPLQAPSGLDADSARFAAALAGRVIDGARLYRAAKAAHPGLPAVDASDQQKMDGAMRDWLAWYESFVSEPGAPLTSWTPGRMQYAFSVSAAAPEGEITLEAPDYRGDALDWFDFQVRSGAVLGAPAGEMKRESLGRTTIPAPVRYPGMPADGWWEFEDANVDFGAVDAIPGDSTALVMLQFAVTYGNDWFMIPLPLAVGSLSRITSLTITDSFGITTPIPSFSKTTGAADSWRMFTVSGPADADILFLPPTLAQAAPPRQIENVILTRDEMANMAWAIEKKVLDATGKVIDRTRDPQQPVENGSAELQYLLATAVPENWVPLVPVSQPDTSRILLRRGAMNLTGTPVPHAQGAIAGAAGPLIINDEEIPRSGARVIRSARYARWIDGSTHLWIGRTKSAGQGEANSGLQFDAIVPSGATAPT